MGNSEFTTYTRNKTLAGIYVALSVAVFVSVFFSSCEKKIKNEVVKGFTDIKKVPTLRTLDVTTMISDSGITRYKTVVE